jgi:hypothetical protein
VIIGILGQSGSGKDTIADYLVKKYRFVKVALADPLKRICKEVYGFSDLQLWGPPDMRNSPDFRYPTGKGYLSPRVALQTLGTEWGRSLYLDTWINYGLKVADDILSRGMHYDPKKGVSKPSWWRSLMSRNRQGVVFSDVRFKNEVDKIRRRTNGFVVRVLRPGAIGLVGLKGHSSEEEQKSLTDDDFDYTINNTGSLSQLYEEVDKMLKKLPTFDRPKAC